MEEGNGDGWRDEWCCCSSSMNMRTGVAVYISLEVRIGFIVVF